MQPDFRVTVPATIVLDELTICRIEINFKDEHMVLVEMKDKRDTIAGISIRNGKSEGVSYDSGFFETIEVDTPYGAEEAMQALIVGALPGLSSFLLTKKLITCDTGLTVIQPA